jgi:hypothetical protein
MEYIIKINQTFNHLNFWYFTLMRATNRFSDILYFRSDYIQNFSLKFPSPPLTSCNAKLAWEPFRNEYLDFQIHFILRWDIRK